MLVEIPGVLGAEALAAVRERLVGVRFRDGTLTAGSAAARVKRNEELDPDAPLATELNEIVIGALYRHARFRSAVLPHRVSAAFFARYSPGMGYGPHVDDPVMGAGQRYRSDVAITVFLSDREDYEGGELVVRTAFGETAVKLAAGDAVAYPASSLHEVRDVRAGERLVAVAWAQSLVRDPARREVLYELDVARQALERATPAAEVTASLQRAYANLVRMWSEL